jgi:hypothetical protein
MTNIPAPRDATPADPNCKHKRTRRKKATISGVTKPVTYHQVWCRDCGGWLRNEVDR